MKRSPVLGTGDACGAELFILQRSITISFDSRSATGYIAIRADPRHVPSMLDGLGLSKASGARTPRVKRTAEDEAKRKISPPLRGTDVTLFRSQVMRASYLSQDRPDIQESVRCLATAMAEPKEWDLADLKRLARYLKTRPTAELRWPLRSSALAPFRGNNPFKECPGNSLHIFSDADWAGDPGTRKSATGFCALRSGACIRSASTTQSIIGLSSCESEFYALCRASASGIGIQSHLADLGIAVDVLVWSDASAARAVASRRGLGKVRHLHTRYLWLQDTVACRAIVLRTIHGTENPADAFTKALTCVALDGHTERLGLYYV